VRIEKRVPFQAKIEKKILDRINMIYMMNFCFKGPPEKALKAFIYEFNKASIAGASP